MEGKVIYRILIGYLCKVYIIIVLYIRHIRDGQILSCLKLSLLHRNHDGCDRFLIRWSSCRPSAWKRRSILRLFYRLIGACSYCTCVVVKAIFYRFPACRHRLYVAKHNRPCAVSGNSAESNVIFLGKHINHCHLCIGFTTFLRIPYCQTVMYRSACIHSGQTCRTVGHSILGIQVSIILFQQGHTGSAVPVYGLMRRDISVLSQISKALFKKRGLFFRHSLCSRNLAEVFRPISILILKGGRRRIFLAFYSFNCAGGKYQIVDAVAVLAYYTASHLSCQLHRDTPACRKLS